jgi:hypothetical protein
MWHPSRIALKSQRDSERNWGISHQVFQQQSKHRKHSKQHRFAWDQPAAVF